MFNYFSPLPVGLMGEEGSEAKNKYYRSFRLQHARRSSRKNNLTDVFLRAMDTSDPFLSSTRTCRTIAKRRKPLNDILHLLQPAEPETSFDTLVEGRELDFEDEEEEEEYLYLDEEIDIQEEVEIAFNWMEQE